MRVLICFLFCCHLTYGSVVNNVRLIEPIPYMINVITETVHRIEDIEWCSLKVPDATVDVNEIVFGEAMNGSVSYKNGFVVSVKQVDILQHSLGQIWRYDRTSNTTTVQITGTLRMTDVTIGFDVEAALSDGVHRYTSELLMPLISFDMAVVKDMFTEAVEVTATPTVTRTSNRMVFLPADATTDVYANLYDVNFVTPGVTTWASEFIQPFAMDIVENVIQYPTICYDCPVA